MQPFERRRFWVAILALCVIAVAVSITILVWLLIGRPSDHPRDREAQNGGSRAGLTSRVIP